MPGSAKLSLRTPLDEWVAVASADLVQRLGIDGQEIVVRSARHVTWPDTSLGCRESGAAYPQVLTPGVLIELEARGRAYSYHGGAGRGPFLCPNPGAPAAGDGEA